LDLNYFLSYNLSRIQLAFNDFKKEVKEKFSENRENIRKFMNL
jgi:hypothetical protein